MATKIYYEVEDSGGLVKTFDDYMEALMCANNLWRAAMKYGGDEFLRVVEVTRKQKDWEHDVDSLMKG